MRSSITWLEGGFDVFACCATNATHKLGRLSNLDASWVLVPVQWRVGHALEAGYWEWQCREEAFEFLLCLPCFAHVLHLLV